MGLETYGDSSIVFLKLKFGHLCEVSKTEIDGWKKVEGELQDKTKYVKWIKPYRGVTGFVNKIEPYEREHKGRKYRGWNIHIDADGTKCVLEIPFDSRVNGRFMKLAENIDYHKPVRFSAWQDRKDDTLAINVQQDGVTVPQKYTREEPNGLPEPIQRSSGKWDYGEQEDFLVDRLVRFVIPKVELIAANRNGASKPEEPKEPEKTKTVAEAAGLEDVDPDESEMSEPLKDINRSVKALAGTKVVNNATEAQLLEDYFGTSNWSEIEKMPEGLLKAQANKLDQLIPF